MSGAQTTIMGDAGFADNTLILGEESETRQAIQILMVTITDWEEKETLSKTDFEDFKTGQTTARCKKGI